MMCDEFVYYFQSNFTQLIFVSFSQVTTSRAKKEAKAVPGMATKVDFESKSILKDPHIKMPNFTTELTCLQPDYKIG